MLDLNEILSRDDEAPYIDVGMPEWGDDVRVYAISEAEHNDALKQARVNGEVDNHILWIILRAQSLRISKDASAVLATKPVRLVNRIDTAINRLNGWTAEARREDEKLFRTP